MANYKRNQTTWSTVKATWRHRETTVIRVPLALVDEIKKYALALDRGEIRDIDLVIAQFLKVKKTQYRRSGLRFNTGTPTWKIFNEFLRWLKIQS